ncbi:MAG: HEAT repeat domain-containing protein [Thermoanaerobaculia bacterium]
MSRTKLILVVALCLAMAGCARFRVKQALKDLDSPDAKTRAAAAETLGGTKAPEAVPPLVAALKDKDSAVRVAAVRALGHIGRAEAVEPLLAAAADQDLSEAADAALKDIGAAGEEALLAALRKKPVSIHAVRALGAMKSEKAVEPLLALAFDSSQESAEEAREAVGRIGGARVTQAAMERANATEPATRKLAYEILGALKSRDAVPMLIEKLADPDREIAASAAAALGAIGDDRAIEPLFAALRAKGKDSDALQPAAGRALGAFGAPVVPRLLESLEDGDEFVRAAAASGLGKTGDARVVPALIRHLGDDGGENTSYHSTLGAALADAGPAAVGPVLEAAKNPKEKIRSGALMALNASKDERATPAILAMLRDPSADIRHTAGWMVWFRKDPRIDSYLAEAMKKKDLQVVEAAIAYYVSKGLPGSEPVLIEVLNRTGQDESMIDTTVAGLLLNSGNETLEKAARKWAEKRGMSVQKEEQDSTIHPQWGAALFK